MLCISKYLCSVWGRFRKFPQLSLGDVVVLASGLSCCHPLLRSQLCVPACPCPSTYPAASLLSDFFSHPPHPIVWHYVLPFGGQAAATISSVLLVVRARFRRRTRQVENPRPVVVCGPAGVGKGTLLDGRLLKEFPNAFAKCVSHTTRAPRIGEVDGVHYHFSEKVRHRRFFYASWIQDLIFLALFFSKQKAMEKEISRGLFIESANVHGNLYGTSIRAVQDVANQGSIFCLASSICNQFGFDEIFYMILGKICILEIDVQVIMMATYEPWVILSVLNV